MKRRHTGQSADLFLFGCPVFFVSNYPGEIPEMARGRMTLEAQQTEQQQGQNQAQTTTQQAQANPNGQQTTQQQAVAKTETPESFEKWLVDQPEAVKELFDSHIDGLKSALDSERSGRKELEKQLKNLSKQAGEGSELKTQIDKLTTEMQQSDSRAVFYEGAHEAGVKNLKLAWIAAKEYDVQDRNGNVDFAKLKSFVPELFATQTKVVPPANAGNGANQAPVAQPDMNMFLRRATGRTQ